VEDELKLDRLETDSYQNEKPFFQFRRNKSSSRVQSVYLYISQQEEKVSGQTEPGKEIWSGHDYLSSLFELYGEQKGMECFEEACKKQGIEKCTGLYKLFGWIGKQRNRKKAEYLYYGPCILAGDYRYLPLQDAEAALFLLNSHH